MTRVVCDSCGIVQSSAMTTFQNLTGTNHHFCRSCAESLAGFAQLRAHAGKTEQQIIQEIVARYPKPGLALNKR